MRRLHLSAALSLALGAAASDNPQQIFQSSSSKKRELTGRFMHITDFHPDKHYVAGATLDSGCHVKPEKKNKKSKESKVDQDDLAGPWGVGASDCDSPMSLVNMTFDWLKAEWANEVDFVVWTGDSARHDNDRGLPRTPSEIFASNQLMVDKMRETFAPEVVIVPSLGNNDIWPHNVLAPGPNTVTAEFSRIWKHFIPADDRHVFERGAYFSTEVIPDRLAVISLNTMFWFNSNTLVDGCRHRSHDPGALEMDWLEVQLEEFRERGMQVWLAGHIPPSFNRYFEDCHLRYGDLAIRFQDTIVGHLFGHMNVDHFYFVDVFDLEHKGPDGSEFGKATDSEDAEYANSTLFSSFAGPEPRNRLRGSGRYRTRGRGSNTALSILLRKDFGEMPQKIKLKDYSVINVGASIIPTYYPGIRVFQYNVSGDGKDDYRGASVVDLDEDYALLDEDDMETAFGGWKNDSHHRHGKKKGSCKKPENEDRPHCVFNKLPRYYNKTSPSRQNRPMTPLGFTQFYLPDIDTKSKTPPKWKIEYATFKPSLMVPNVNETGQPPPVPLHMLPGHKAGEEYTLTKAGKKLKKLLPWKMKDLTIGSYVRLAKLLTEDDGKWDTFRKFMYVSSD